MSEETFELQDERPAPFWWIEHSIFLQGYVARISASAFVTYCCLAHHANRWRRSWPSIPRLVKLTGLHERTIYDAIKELEEESLIRVEHTPGRTNRYVLLPVEKPAPEAPLQKTTVVQKSTGDPCKKLQGTPAKNYRGTRISNKNQETNEPAARGVPDQEKERTPKQQENDRRYERMNGLYGAYCNGIGLDPESVPAQMGRAVAFRQLKPLVDLPEPTPEEFERATRHFARDRYWTEKGESPSLPYVLRHYPAWKSKQSPTTTRLSRVVTDQDGYNTRLALRPGDPVVCEGIPRREGEVWKEGGDWYCVVRAQRFALEPSHVVTARAQWEALRARIGLEETNADVS